MPIKQLKATELLNKINNNEPMILLDVREPYEYDHVNINGSVLIPLNQIPARLQEIDFDSEIITICHHGIRSQQAANFLCQVGYKNVCNLSGGIDAWALECDNTMPRY